MLTYVPVYAKICANSLIVWVSDKEVLCTHAHHIYSNDYSCHVAPSKAQFSMFFLFLPCKWIDIRPKSVIFFSKFELTQNLVAICGLVNLFFCSSVLPFG